ncbi:restriction endonuclease [Streptomyces fradiae]|uniref:Restriction endonuclease n=2 Tax=Streptomyces TaxID=1883 RepID=A0A3S5ILE4_9ACTN|nr:restriction endonuclease [Streptomyces fradiae]OFA39192.1 restriction endonuclease [Streptomyces fradiae]PQM22942.1 restriction endonuclease [Streptomyces xinghaiensis]RKM97416.1 restriction endonuclease [Streptomyces xinghaiensis]RNC73750.1 restriction endonuclease [Streptomyces xinghaiensis]
MPGRRPGLRPRRGPRQRLLRWPGLRKPRGAGEHAAAGLVALAAAAVLTDVAIAVWNTMLGHWPVVAALAAGACAYGTWHLSCSLRARRERAARLATLRLTLAQIDALDDQQFEHALRDLLIRDGWQARQVGRQGDQAADVIGQDRQRGRIVLQAKHTGVGGKVGVQVMYQVKGTAGPVHRADHAVVVTNGSLTRDAKAWGDRHRIHWIDRDRLRQWAEHGLPLHELLRLPGRTPRRGRTDESVRRPGRARLVL